MNNKSSDGGFRGFKVEVFKSFSDEEKDKDKYKDSDYFRRLSSCNNTTYSLRGFIKRFY